MAMIFHSTPAINTAVAAESILDQAEEWVTTREHPTQDLHRCVLDVH
jgi:hypothetical protein